MDAVPLRICSSIWLALVSLVAVAGCASWRQYRPEVDGRCRPAHPRAILFVVDGAGDFRATSRALNKAIAAEELPIQLETFIWSHGYCRIFADQTDMENVRTQGHRLADEILATRQAHPGCPIFLLGHSAGCGVVLTAAERLPANTLDRIILFAPSVAADYDLRPSLASSRLGIDSFCSLKDYWYLNTGTLLCSLKHCQACSAAGCTGFRPPPPEAGDSALYAKLRQYPWRPWLAWTGHDGGHYGCYQQGFLRAFVLPLLGS